jgi:hypothetical protein
VSLPRTGLAPFRASWSSEAPLGGHPTTAPDELEFTSQGHALLHVTEEACQHLGQMEITRDLLRQR